MANGSCRMHGGRSTGPSTPEGLARVTAARTVHGCYGAEGGAFRIGCRTLLARGRLLAELERDPDFGRNPDDLRPFLEPIFPKPQRRKRSQATAPLARSSLPRPMRYA
jgi:hypothetical protein